MSTTTMSVPIQDSSRHLNCLIEGESIVFSVTVGHDCLVSDLKEVIQGERTPDTLKDPHPLELWKVSAIAMWSDIAYSHYNRSTLISDLTITIPLAASKLTTMTRATKT
jgi:hypothetical protein